MKTRIVEVTSGDDKSRFNGVVKETQNRAHLREPERRSRKASAPYGVAMPWTSAGVVGGPCSHLRAALNSRSEWHVDPVCQDLTSTCETPETEKRTLRLGRLEKHSTRGSSRRLCYEDVREGAAGGGGFAR